MVRVLANVALCGIVAFLGWGSAEEAVGATLAVGEGLEGFTPQRGQLVVLTLRGLVFWVKPSSPAQVEGAVVPVGLPEGDALVSIASRPASRQIYVRSRFGGLYRLDLRSGVLRQAGRVTIAFGGATSEAAAFSPTKDRLRVVTDIRTNYRIDPQTGDAQPDYELATKGVISAIAYTPAGACGTTLFGLDRARRELVRIGGAGGNPPPASGQVTAIGPLRVPRGDAFGGLAIESSGQAYVALSNGDAGTTLHSVDLASGTATLIGPLGSGGLVRGIAAV